MSRSLRAVRARVRRYRWLGSRRAVLGPGVLADAGPLWRSAMAAEGTSVHILHALARLHWSRYQASRPDDLVIDIYEGTTAAYPRHHPFWEGDMNNLEYARRLRAGD